MAIVEEYVYLVDGTVEIIYRSICNGMQNLWQLVQIRCQSKEK